VTGSGNPAELIIRPAATADLPVVARLAVAERGGKHAQWRARFAADLAASTRRLTPRPTSPRPVTTSPGSW
jgi:hypothetical protein